MTSRALVPYAMLALCVLWLVMAGINYSQGPNWIFMSVYLAGAVAMFVAYLKQRPNKADEAE